MTRIIDKINDKRKQLDAFRKGTKSRDNNSETQDVSENSQIKGFFYSFEFFPPKTEAGEENLLTRIDRMAQRLDPLFIDVTWGGPSTSTRSLAVASYAQKYLGLDVLLHLAAQGMGKEDLTRVLSQAKLCGIQNILALRGDPPRGKRSWLVGDVSGGFCDRATDLIRFIRELHGDYFGIAIAGHPEGHPSSTSPEDEIKDLKEKVDVGAGFIITQFFYDTDLFINYAKKCRSAGITCPILPGIMPIQSYSSFSRMTKYCNISVPDSILKKIETVKDDDEAVKDIGCELAADMCRRILLEGQGIDGVHFYTLNLERSVTRVLVSMGAVSLITPQLPSTIEESKGDGPVPLASTAETIVRTTTGRALPWRPSALEKRASEKVRPINWANRPKSYVQRTEDWDEFPNGRWGDATSPAFGELSGISHFYSFSVGSDDDLRAMLGHEPKVPQDVYEVFAQYIEGRIPHIPWCESALQPESFLIQKDLAKLNRKGFLTVNSQPAVNGEPSSDPICGWGGPGGYVYQKAYCECFCSPENAQRLVKMARMRNSVHLYAVNIEGDQIQEGIELGGVTALTWGVFPNREILQPTIFDPSTFLVWADEAFSLWSSMWLHLYDFDSESYELIETIRNSYFLCAIVDNDYIEKEGKSSLWKAMLSATQE